MGLVAAIAVVCLAGVGFSAFTAQAVVYGGATSAKMGLEITDTYSYGCDFFYNIPNAPGKIVVTGENGPDTAITVQTSNLTPAVYCTLAYDLVNTGSVPVNVSVQLQTAGAGGMCVAYQASCYGIFTWSGIATDGTIWWIGAPNFGIPTDSNNNFVTLAPGGHFTEYLGVDIPPASTDSTPPSAAFTLVYTATPSGPSDPTVPVYTGETGA